MESTEMKRADYWAYVVGAVIGGGVILGPLLSYLSLRYLPIETAPTFAKILLGSLLLSIAHVKCLDRKTGRVHFLFFLLIVFLFNLLSLAAYFLSQRPDSAYLLSPGVLMFVLCSVCGGFSQALWGVVSRKNDDQSASAASRSALRRTSGFMAILTGVMILGAIYAPPARVVEQWDDSPVLVRLSLSAERFYRQAPLDYQRMASQIGAMEGVASVTMSTGQAPGQVLEKAPRYRAELLIEVTLKEAWHRVTARQGVEQKLIAQLGTPMDRAWLVDEVTPPIPAKSAKPALEAKFVPRPEVLQVMNLNLADVQKELAAIIRLASDGLGLKDVPNVRIFNEQGQGVRVSDIGNIQFGPAESTATELPPGTWGPISPGKPSAEGGFLIQVDLLKLQAYGLPLSVLEQKVVAAFEGALRMDKETLEALVIKEGAGGRFLLRDIARITGPQTVERPEGRSASAYRIEWQ